MPSIQQSDLPPGVHIHLAYAPEGIVVKVADEAAQASASRLVLWSDIESPGANPVKRAISDLMELARVK